MKPQRITLLAITLGLASAPGFAQTPGNPPAENQHQAPATAQNPATSSTETTPGNSEKESARADAYYNYTMGHIYEQQYEASSSPDYATKAIEAYKKAYALDPKSPVIGERLAEMYWKAQRIHDAVGEAQGILKRDPDNVQSRRLLGRIYLRSLGDVSSSNGQPETVNRAIEQYREINRLDPSDTESALWLARLYRLKNEHDKAEQVLRSILKTDPESEDRKSTRLNSSH